MREIVRFEICVMITLIIFLGFILYNLQGYDILKVLLFFTGTAVALGAMLALPLGD